MEPVTMLNPNNVLLGRGTGYHEYIGNQRFLALVEERKEVYNTAAKNKTKSRLAKEFLDHIHSLGGRFLRRADSAQPVDIVVEEGVWYETDEKTALDKIKQAFRQNRDYRRFQKKGDSKVGDDVNARSQEENNGGVTGDGPSSLGAADLHNAARVDSGLFLLRHSRHFVRTFILFCH
jgi:hypothetical protein